MNPPWAVVLFDLDGTVANTIPLILASYAHATEKVLGQPATSIESRQWIGRTLVDTFAERYPGCEGELIAAYTEWSSAHLDELVRPYVGMGELLASLPAAGVRTGIVTSKRRPGAQRTLEAVGLDGVIDIVCAMEDTARHKPAPDPLLRAMEVLSAAPSETVYVGDAAVDLLAADAAGCAGIGVTWGAGLADELAAQRSIAVVDGLGELRTLLGAP